MSELNESSHIMLSMINMFFVLCYVCVIQFMITDSQSALVMLRALGTFVAATLTISIVLGPKVVQLLKPKKWGGAFPKIEKIENVVNCVTIHYTSCNYRCCDFYDLIPLLMSSIESYLSNKPKQCILTIYFSLL